MPAFCLMACPATAQNAAAPTPLLDDLGGARTLGNVGITLGLTDTENLFGNVSGGVKQGATNQGVTEATHAWTNEGNLTEAWTVEFRALPTSVPFRPARTTPT